jgi:hypothetical protein
MSEEKGHARPKITVVEETATETPDAKTEVKPEIKEPATVVTVAPPPVTTTPALPKNPKSDKLPFWVVFVTLLFGILLGAGLVSGVFYYKNAVTAPQSTPEPEVTETPSVLPTATPVAIKKDVTINILNGSGKKGEAGKVEELLKSANFTKTTTGNAASYNFKTTDIAYKKTVSTETINQIKAALVGYDVKLLTTEPKGTTDVEITVGSTFLTPTPSPKAVN